MYVAASVCAIGLLLAGSKQRRLDTDAELVQTAAWAVLKSHLAEVVNWAFMPYGALIRLPKLNDQSKMTVFDCVIDWVSTNRLGVDADVVAGLLEPACFPTMSMGELEQCAGSEIFRT